MVDKRPCTEIGLEQYFIYDLICSPVKFLDILKKIFVVGILEIRQYHVLLWIWSQRLKKTKDTWKTTQNRPMSSYLVRRCVFIDRNDRLKKVFRLLPEIFRPKIEFSTDLHECVPRNGPCGELFPYITYTLWFEYVNRWELLDEASVKISNLCTKMLKSRKLLKYKLLKLSKNDRAHKIVKARCQLMYSKC